MSNNYSKIKNLFQTSDYIIIGAGAGLSTAAGVEYSGPNFTNNFQPWIKKYNFKDLYTSSFYNFQSQEEKWAYWSKHIYIANVGMPPTELYKNLLNWVKNKNYFVVTTNVDDQFYKAGFDPNLICRFQGSYAYLQCARACHKKLYEYSEKIKEMVKNINEKNCTIPSKLVPKCPVCNGPMEPNIRKDEFFVEDENWRKMVQNYNNFLKNIPKDKKVLLLEFGIGFNTPGIIRFPFETLTNENKNWFLVRFNTQQKECIIDLGNKFILIDEDIKFALKKIIN
jgi:NAD-dependent SIR2 family protein deacetylase